MGYELKARMALQKHGFKFSNKLGQNFLLSEDLLKKMVDCAEVEAGDCVLEIGPGAGTMTAEMESRGVKVLALEIDETLKPVLSEVLADHPDAAVCYCDALNCDINRLLEKYFPRRKVKVVANLPYYITTELVLKLVRNPAPFAEIVLMVQKEAAQRIQAEPGTKSYGVLSANVRYWGNVKPLMQLPPEVFTPRPHVHSSLIKIMPHEHKLLNGAEEGILYRLIDACFAMRRKTLVNNLCASFAMTREEAVELLRTEGLSEKIRGEALTNVQIISLSKQIALCKK